MNSNQSDNWSITKNRAQSRYANVDLKIQNDCLTNQIPVETDSKNYQDCSESSNLNWSMKNYDNKSVFSPKKHHDQFYKSEKPDMICIPDRNDDQVCFYDGNSAHSSYKGTRSMGKHKRYRDIIHRNENAAHLNQDQFNRSISLAIRSEKNKKNLYKTEKHSKKDEKRLSNMNHDEGSQYLKNRYVSAVILGNSKHHHREYKMLQFGNTIENSIQKSHQGSCHGSVFCKSETGSIDQYDRRRMLDPNPTNGYFFVY